MSDDFDWLVPQPSHGPLVRRGEPTLNSGLGRAAAWHEPGWPHIVEEVPHTFVTREIVGAPTSESLALGPQEPAWQRMRQVSMSLLASAAFIPGCAALELRYVTTPDSSGGATRIQLFITAKVRSWDPVVAVAAVEAACDALPPGFVGDTPSLELGLGDGNGEPGLPIFELRRHEEITFPEWQHIPAEFYYTINDDPGDGSGWPGYWQSLARATQRVEVSLLFMQTDLHWEERDALSDVAANLALYSETRTAMNYVYQQQETFNGCVNAKKAFESWTKRIDELQRPLITRIAVRGNVEYATPVATALASAIGVRSGSYAPHSHPMYVDPPLTAGDARQAAHSFDWLEVLPWGGHQIWTFDEAPISLRRLPYLFGLHEASGIAVLPVPDHQGVPGMPLSRRAEVMRETLTAQADDQGPSVRLGRALNEGRESGSLHLPLSAVNRHALVVGAPKSGKTTTVLSLLARLWREHRIPFTVLESVKTEYRSLLSDPGLRNDLTIITLGNEAIAPLRLNPLEPPPGVRCEVHIGSVLASLKMALPLFDPQPAILATSLQRVYDRAGWDDGTTIADGIAPPTLRDLLAAYQQVFDRNDYKGEAKNIGIGFRVRLEGLLQGSRGRVLDTARSSDFGVLLQRPLVIEMDDLHDPDEKAIFAAFLLDRIRADARSRGSGNTLRHVTVIEEAHRVLAEANAGGRSTEGGNHSRADSVRAFCEAIAELRAWGEGFILSSQSPSELAQAAVKITGTRVIHRLESDVDRQQMLKDVGASEDLVHAAARLRTGEAIARWPERDEAALLYVEADAFVNSSKQLSNEEVATHMAAHREAVQRQLPYELCSPGVCITGCVPRVKRLSKSAADDLASQVIEITRDPSVGRGEAASRTATFVAQECAGDRQRTYCTAVHLSLSGAAFPASPGRDDRPVLIKLIDRAIKS